MDGDNLAWEAMTYSQCECGVEGVNDSIMGRSR